MTEAFINTIKTAVPPHDVHGKFVGYAHRLLHSDRDRALFSRMAARAHISHRYSFLAPAAEDNRLDMDGFYTAGSFPDTNARMRRYQENAFGLARAALDKLDTPPADAGVTHVIVTSCTGFYAPGLDLDIIRHYGLRSDAERSFIGFMGCHAAINGLKLARHIVRSDAKAKILLLNLELCTLHLQEVPDIERVLSFLIFADGCAASIVSAEEKGIRLESFYADVIPDSAGLITWRIGGAGFDMNLSGAVPQAVAAALPGRLRAMTGGHNDIPYWAVHPGGRSVLDAVREGAQLDTQQMRFSDHVLQDFGNMSSATVMFVLEAMMRDGAVPGRGCGMAFGPGLSIEGMTFEVGL